MPSATFPPVYGLGLELRFIINNQLRHSEKRGSNLEKLVLKNINKNYGSVVAVDDLSLTIEEGEFITLLGPSGCGKTTLLRSISGFEELDSGDILIDSQKMTDVPPYKRPVNTVFQNYALFPHLNVEKNIGYGLDVIPIMPTAGAFIILVFGYPVRTYYILRP